MIVAYARDLVIGDSNDIPWYLPADLKHFREVTMGNTVIMGRKTHDSIVGRLHGPLPGRQNIVLTRDRDFSSEGFKAVHNLSEALQHKNGDLFIIGGEQVYREAMPYADRLYITEIDAAIRGDTYFPRIDMQAWREVSREPHSADDRNPHSYTFITLERS